jgi:hypothetical protein
MRSFRMISGVARALSAPPARHQFAALPRRALVGVATAALLLTLLLTLGLAGVGSVAAQDRPPGGVLTNPVVRAIDLASPAVVRIATLYSAHLRLTACGVTTSLPKSGAYTLGGLGSGAFVSANGDILTADHVVDIDRASLDSVIFSGARVSGDVAAFLNNACHPSVPVTPDDVANGIVQFNGLPFSTTYSAPRVLVWQSASYFGTASGGTASDATNQLEGLMKATYNEATVLKTSSFEQDDVALIHVGLTDTPSIQLDPSSELAVEDALTVIGFPGNGDVNGDPTNLLTPSVNNVNVSAIKRNDNGSQLIQVGGNVEHGDSGGPALDVAGHIVGIVSFGGADNQGITAFLRSSDSALTVLRDAQIDTTPGTFQKLWEQAFADYADTAPGHWQTASREMDALTTRYPNFHGLDAYRAYADTAAAREAPTTPAFQALNPPFGLSLPVAAAIVGGVILLLLLLIIVSGARRRARHRRARAQAAAIAPSPWAPAGLPPGYNSATAPGGYNGSPYATTYTQPSYNAPAPPTRPADGRPWPSSSGYPQQPGQQQQQQQQQQPYPYVASAATPASAPGYMPQVPGYPPRANPSTPSYAAPSGPAAGLSSATPPQAGGGGQSGPASSPASSPWSSPATQSAQDGAASAFCVNGHPMPPGAFRCVVCGADRARPIASAPRDASVPPQGQNW